jgi:hypothetical protein
MYKKGPSLSRAVHLGCLDRDPRQARSVQKAPRGQAQPVR